MTDLTNLMLDCLISDSITDLERGKITILQFNNRIKKLEKQKEDNKCTI